MSSKLFLGSTRKHSILAAMSNPINVELLAQLEEYVSDEDKEYLNPEPQEEPTEETAEEILEETTDAEPAPSSPAPASFTPSHEPISERHEEELAELDAENSEKLDATEPTSESKSEPEEVKESVKVTQTKIVADTTTTTINPQLEIHAGLNQIAYEIKGTLNARAATAGVLRVNLKGDELWIYYNDSINLNNVMTEVINTLNSACYQYLVFNRLARTDNAIVFTLSVNDTAQEVVPNTYE